MDITRKHIALVVLSEDAQKTPLANSKTEVLEWWESLDRQGRKKACLEFLNDPKTENLGWRELEFMHEQIMLKLKAVK